MKTLSPDKRVCAGKRKQPSDRLRKLVHKNAPQGKKERTQPNSDQALKVTIDNKTKQFKKTSQQAKEAEWENYCEEARHQGVRTM